MTSFMFLLFYHTPHPFASPGYIFLFAFLIGRPAALGGLPAGGCGRGKARPPKPYPRGRRESPPLSPQALAGAGDAPNKIWRPVWRSKGIVRTAFTAFLLRCASRRTGSGMRRANWAGSGRGLVLQGIPAVRSGVSGSLCAAAVCRMTVGGDAGSCSGFMACKAAAQSAKTHTANMRLLVGGMRGLYS